MQEINEDPIYDIRLAVADTLRDWIDAGDLDTRIDQERFTENVVDRLPDFFRRALEPYAAPEAERQPRKVDGFDVVYFVGEFFTPDFDHLWRAINAGRNA